MHRFAIVLLSAFAACSGEESPVEVKAPYSPWTATTKASYVQTLPNSTTKNVIASVVGTKEVAGRTFQIFRVNDPESESPGLDLWANHLDPTTLEIAGGVIDSSEGLALGLPIHASATLVEPLRIALDGPVGQPVPVKVKGTSVLGQGNPEQAEEITMSYTLAEKDVTVQTSAGTIAGCHRYEASAQVKLLLGADPTEMKGQAWYSPTLGLVKAQLDQPFALGMSLRESADAADLGDGWASVQKLGVVGKDHGRSWRLATYDVRQEFDADKDTHAKLLLEIRWADETMAKTDQQPSVQPEFGTTFGIFPSSLVRSSVSFFHPEENGQGYVYWIGFVDQAAKNQPTNGISYRIEVSYNDTFSPIRLTGRIIYKRAPGEG